MPKTNITAQQQSQLNAGMNHAGLSPMASIEYRTGFGDFSHLQGYENMTWLDRLSAGNAVPTHGQSDQGARDAAAQQAINYRLQQQQEVQQLQQQHMDQLNNTNVAP